MFSFGGVLELQERLTSGRESFTLAEEGGLELVEGSDAMFHVLAKLCSHI
jgi:hypothetical protein